MEDEVKVEDIIAEPDVEESDMKEEPETITAVVNVEEKPDERSSAKDLIAYIKVTAQNIRTLHRHLVGGNWFDDHERLASYYSLVDDIEDAIVEMLLALGCDDASICEGCEKFKVLDPKQYSSKEAFVLVKLYFEKIRQLIKDFHDETPDIPNGVVSKLDDIDYTLFLESRYKLNRFLNDEIDDSLMENIRAYIKG